LKLILYNSFSLAYVLNPGCFVAYTPVHSTNYNYQTIANLHSSNSYFAALTKQLHTYIILHFLDTKSFIHALYRLI